MIGVIFDAITNERDKFVACSDFCLTHRTAWRRAPAGSALRDPAMDPPSCELRLLSLPRASQFQGTIHALQVFPKRPIWTPPVDRASASMPPQRRLALLLRISVERVAAGASSQGGAERTKQTKGPRETCACWHQQGQPGRSACTAPLLPAAGPSPCVRRPSGVAPQLACVGSFSSAKLQQNW